MCYEYVLCIINIRYLNPKVIECVFIIDNKLLSCI